MKEFKASEYLKVIKDDMEMVLSNIINFWEEYRCAVSAEYIFNLDNDEELNEFGGIYGVRKAIECIKVCNYWIGGSNYKEPRMVTLCDMLNILNNAYNIETIEGMLEDDYDMVLGQWFKMNEVKAYITNYNLEKDIKSLEIIKKELENKDKKIILSVTDVELGYIVNGLYKLKVDCDKTYKEYLNSGKDVSTYSKMYQDVYILYNRLLNMDKQIHKDTYTE